MSVLKKIFPTGLLLSDEDILIDGKDYFVQFPNLKKNTHCATLYNRSKAQAINFYSFDCLFSDFHSLSRLALTGKVVLSSRKVAEWRQHDANESKSLDENKLINEIASLVDVAVFARQYLSESKVVKWLEQMKQYYYLIFIYHSSTYRPGWKTIAFIIRNWTFNKMYFRYLIKSFLFMFKRGRH